MTTDAPSQEAPSQEAPAAAPAPPPAEPKKPPEEEIDIEEYKTCIAQNRQHKEFHRELNGVSKRVDEAYARVEELKVELKAAKSEHAAAVSRMQKVVKEQKQHRMLFKDDKKQEQPAKAKDEPAKPDEFEDKSWETKSIKELGLSPGVEEKLDSIGVTTIGDLERLRAGRNPDYPRGLVNVKGIGEAKITVIENSVLEWLDRNRDNTKRIAAQEATPGQAPKPAEKPPEEAKTEPELRGGGAGGGSINALLQEAVNDPVVQQQATQPELKIVSAETILQTEPEPKPKKSRKKS